MKHSSDRYKSRFETPWDAEDELTASQTFISHHYKEHYMQRHPKLEETGEVELINSYAPVKCPYCGSKNIKRHSIRHNKSCDVQRIECNNCGKMFQKPMPTPEVTQDA